MVGWVVVELAQTVGAVKLILVGHCCTISLRVMDWMKWVVVDLTHSWHCCTVVDWAVVELTQSVGAVKLILVGHLCTISLRVMDWVEWVVDLTHSRNSLAFWTVLGRHKHSALLSGGG